MSRLLVLQHLDRESPGLLLRIAYERGMSTFVCRLDQGELLPEPVQGDLLVILGGELL